MVYYGMMQYDAGLPTAPCTPACPQGASGVVIWSITKGAVAKRCASTALQFKSASFALGKASFPVASLYLCSFCHGPLCHGPQITVPACRQRKQQQQQALAWPPRAAARQD